MTDFVEERFNTEIRYGLVGGPTFSTDVVVVNSGHESRNINWDESLGKWQIGDDLYTKAELGALIAFFRTKRGRAVGFRLKDWTDFTVSITEGIMSPASANGSKQYQLLKLYSSALDSYSRTIKKPVTGAVLLLAGAEWTGATLDTTTGLVTANVIIAPKGITSLSKASSAVIGMPTGHGFVNTDKVWIEGIVGMTQMNNRVATVTGSAANSITVDVDSTSFSTYTSGGTVAKYTQSGALTWSGEFDVPVRFDTDQFSAEFVAYRDDDGEALHQVGGLPIVEIPV